MKLILYLSLIWLCYGKEDLKKTKFKLPDHMYDREHRVGGVSQIGEVIRTKSATGLKNHAKYLDEIMQKFIYSLEEYDFSRLPFQDFTYNISKVYYTLNVTGNVYFNNGFMISINNIMFPEDVKYILDEKGLTAKVYTKVMWEDILTMNDFRADIGSKLVTGTVFLTYPNLYYELGIVKDLNTGNIQATTKYLSNTYPSWDFDPKNDYTDALKNEIIRSKITNKIIDGFGNWSSDAFQDMWGKVLGSVPFPEICNYCFT